MNEKNLGWISVHRKLKENPIFEKPNYLAVWLFILLNANHKEKNFIWNNKKTVVKEGQCITSIRKIADQFGLSTGTVSYILDYLSVERMIERSSNKKFTVITVLNWHDYQSVERSTENKLKTNEKQIETNNNVNNVNNINNGKIASPLNEEDYEEGSLGHTLATKPIQKSKGTGITKAWQDQAFRFADALGIKLETNDMKARWLREFKLGSQDKMKQANLNRAYGYLIDYAPFQKLDSEGRMKYFFWYLGNQ